MRLGSRQGRRARLAAQYVLQWGTHDGQEMTMTDPDEADLSPEEILREAETAFSKAARLFATGHQEKSIIWPELNKTVFWGGFCGVPG